MGAVRLELAKTEVEGVTVPILFTKQRKLYIGATPSRV
jgi:hypothetical protein